MKSGFGLKLLHKFLNLPYLCLQRQALQTQMEVNAQEIEATKLELELYLESDEADYDLYLEGVTQVLRQLLARLDIFIWFTSKKYSLRMLAADSRNVSQQNSFNVQNN